MDKERSITLSKRRLKLIEKRDIKVFFTSESGNQLTVQYIG